MDNTDGLQRAVPMRWPSLFPKTNAGNPTRAVHFHVGAHKTATTYMQSRLRSNKERLREREVDFIDLWSRGVEQKLYRKNLEKLLDREVVDEQGIAQASKQLRQIVDNGTSADSSLVIMSYENVLGDYDLSKGNALYPNAALAVRHLAQAFADCKLTIFFSIRSLDRVIESGYLQRVSSKRETRNFKHYVDKIDIGCMSWIPVVRAIESVVGQESIFVWAYEDFVTDEQPAWNALLARPDAEAVLDTPAKRANYSLSAKGLKYMRSINKFATPADARKFRPFVKSHFGLQAGLNPPKLLDDDRRRQLISSYERDRLELGSTCRLRSRKP